MKTFSETVRSVANYFREELKQKFDSSEIEQMLQITFAHYFSLTKSDLILNGDDRFQEANYQKVKDVIGELKTNKPLAQIIGEWEFFDLPFKVTEQTLIPRPETEELVELIIKDNLNQDNISILDIGTGTGCIAISLKSQISDSMVSAFDISEEALIVASGNAVMNNTVVDFEKNNILKPVNRDNSYDVIVSNPPYITEKEKQLMHKNVLDYEPHLALFVRNEEPILFYIAIADFAINHLNKNGKLYFEINEHFGQEVKDMLIEKKFKNVNVVKDINDKDRIVYCNI